MTSPALKTSTEELLEQYLDAWQRHDVDAIVSYHTPDTEFTAWATGNTAVGLEALRRVFTGTFALWPDLHFTERRLYTTPELIVFESTIEMTQAIPLTIQDRVIEPNGTQVAVEAADILTLRDGLVSSKTTYFDMLGYEVQMRGAPH